MTDDIERVAMYWPADLKRRVRDLVGGRGLSAFVIAAVEAKLGTPTEPPPEVDAPPEDDGAGEDTAGEALTVETVVRIDEPVVDEPVVDEPVAQSARITEALLTRQRETDAAVDSVDEQEPAPGDEPTPEAVAAEFDRDTQQERTDHIAATFGLQPASTLATPTAPTVDAAPPVEREVTGEALCTTCQSVLVNGECWVCDM